MKLDLSIGHPSFLAEQWENYAYLDTRVFPVLENLNYQDNDSTENLKKAILQHHRTVGNVANLDSYHLVVGHGASQVLNVYKQTKLQPFATYTAPYWPRFPQVIGPVVTSMPESCCKLVTYPNNPNGELHDTAGADIVDASYHWPAYYKKDEVLKALDNDTIVFSFAKLTGFASMRLGWALVKEEWRARRMREYVEITTGPVSLEVQNKAATIIRASCNLVSPLQERWQRIGEYYPQRFHGGGRGMFLYVSDKAREFEAMNIEGIRGMKFGEESDDKIRINIGCSSSDFNELMARISLMDVRAGRTG